MMVTLPVTSIITTIDDIGVINGSFTASILISKRFLTGDVGQREASYHLLDR
jgi:hypothetical protein